MDLQKLVHDRATDPNLSDCADSSVEDLATRLVAIHHFLMRPESGPLGYLYQQQVRVNRELKCKK